VRRFQKGEEEPIAILAETNKAFVVTMAKKFKSEYLSLEELTNFGMIGIVLAAHKFDFEKGKNFLTYARHYIYSQIQKGIVVSTPCTVTIPRGVYDSMIKVRNLTLSGSSDLEISEILDIELDKIPKLRGIRMKEESLNSISYDDGESKETATEDFIACEESSVENYFDSDILGEVESFLDEQGRIEKIIYCHYHELFSYSKLNYRGLSEITGKSNVAVMKIEKEITKKLIKRFRKEL
jgi:RNA polymerase primary sigma factor